ncbi:hypothetical protein [Mesorhizobium sp. WSM4313]|uniref:hypothetical protein n=1 Tax=Mesorhizobium sp. WSM4313 TaxID=2029412 RepID=UPI000BB07817|nr:hypothetical protein [Mesorhizobium sp. WSM4313]PBB21145.1 hypothetical protein CK219_00455 [Mesorhizobium sp. WSM4313]
MQTDLDPDEAVTLAAEWLRKHRNDPRDRAIVPDLKTRFGISASQACEAIRLSRQGGADVR